MLELDPIALTARLAAAADALLAGSAAPAAVLGLGRGALTLEAASGIADLATGAAAQGSQTYEIGSQTKMMTATVILQLESEGRLGLDGRIALHLDPGLLEGIANGGSTTIRQLLAHVSGIPNYTEVLGESGISRLGKLLFEGEALTPDDSLDIVRGQTADFAPGTGARYSNTGYLLLGRIIEAVSGAPLGQVFEERIFEPLGMDATKLRDGTRTDDRLHSYATLPDSDMPIDVTDAPWDPFAEGGVISNAADMATFLEALLIDRTLLPSTELAAMTDLTLRELVPNAPASLYGLGLEGLPVEGLGLLVGHTGGTLGTFTTGFVEVGSGLVLTSALTGEAGAASFDALFASELLTDPVWSEAAGDVDRVRFVSGSAADLVVDPAGGRTELTLAGLSLDLARALLDVTPDAVSFADGSVLLVGDLRDTGTGDNRRDELDIARDFGASRSADNHLIGLGGDDRLAGGRGDDRLDGGAGADTLLGRDGDDVLEGGTGRDRLEGGGGGDVIEGGAGRDRLIGLGGGDRLDGGADADELWGGQGDDTLRGGLGADRIVGGQGADTFHFGSAAEGGDRIVCYRGAEDRIEVSAAGFGGGLDAGEDLEATGRYQTNTTGLAEGSGAQFVFESDAQRLWWDEDGTGSVDAVLLAELHGARCWRADALFVVA